MRQLTFKKILHLTKIKTSYRKDYSVLITMYNVNYVKVKYQKKKRKQRKKQSQTKCNETVLFFPL